jgi:hypothetical protein
MRKPHNPLAHNQNKELVYPPLQTLGNHTPNAGKNYEHQSSMISITNNRGMPTNNYLVNHTNSNENIIIQNNFTNNATISKID